MLTDLIVAETAKLRPGLPQLPLEGGFWQPDQALGATGLGLDSLERLQIAAAVSETLHMHRSGIADRLLAYTTMGDWCATAATSLQHASDELTFSSSGSTGDRKRVAHSLADLDAEAAGHAALLNGSVRRVLCAVPCHHIYGFIFSLVLPWHLAKPVLDIRQFSPAAIPSLAATGDLIVGYPDFWSAVLRAAPTGWQPGVTGVSSTAPLPDSVAAALLGAGLSRLVQVHGSSETAGIGLREQPGAPYSLLPNWRRTTDHRLAKQAPGGQPVELPDAMEWLTDSTYRLTGRKDGAVQVAGLNVFPGRVAAALRHHPDVAAAAVRLMRPSEGVRLKAFVVPRDPACDPAGLRAALQALAAAELSMAEQPRAYTIGSTLPVDPIGKPADWAVDT